jgi:microcystin-dependent protein
MAEPHVGEIMLVAFNFAPPGWMFCHGQLLPIPQYETLFNLIGTTYGGDGQETFAVPDLRGRVAVGQGQGSGLSGYTLGETTGVETVTLTLNQIPVHTHAFASEAIAATPRCVTSAANQRSPVGNVHALESAGTTMTYSNQGANALMRQDATLVTGALNSISGGAAGNSFPHDNQQPSLGLNFLIATEGIFPSPT